jgi:hypothetical protein
MDAAALRQALLAHFGASAEVNEERLGLDLLLVDDGGERWGFALCPDQPEELAYLAAFEAAMQQAIAARQVQGPGELHLGLALGFASAAAGEAASYRRALKKYSNSIVFEDLELSLFLVQSPQSIIVLAPGEANPFLRDLNRWIAEHRSNET